MNQDKLIEAGALAIAALDFGFKPRSITNNHGTVWEDSRGAIMPGHHRDKYIARSRAAIAAHTAHLEASGMVIVPREPTPDMCDAGDESIKPGDGALNACANIYRAMIVAPTQKIEISGDRG